jgi:hypothetical protein
VTFAVSAEEREMSDSARPDDKKPTAKRSDARRRLLKSLALGAGAATTSVVVPKEWIKPLVNSIEVPLHAQGSPIPTMTCSLSVSIYTFGEGQHVVPENVDSGQDIDDITVELDPAVADQPVHLDIEPLGANDMLIEGVDEADQDELTDAVGQIAFTSAVMNSDEDGSFGDALNGFRATFSSPGLPACVIEVTFEPPA